MNERTQTQKNWCHLPECMREPHDTGPHIDVNGNALTMTPSPSEESARERLRTPQWWLAELDVHGNPKLIDGSHDTEQDAHHAAYLIGALGMKRGRRFAVAKVELIEARPDPTGANEEAIGIMRPLIDAATTKGPSR